MRWGSDSAAGRLAMALAIAAPLIASRGASLRAAEGPPGRRAGADDALQNEIQLAIQSGCKDLLHVLPGLLDRQPAEYPMGHIALVLAAALRGGVPPEDPLVRRAFETLERIPVRETYSAACYLFALEAFVQARVREERERLFDGRSPTAAARPRADLEKPARAPMEKLVRWLLDVRNRGDGTWSYRAQPGGKHDYSNSQFAVLGLQVGLEHKIPIPREVFAEIAHHFTKTQIREGSADFSITLNSQLASLSSKGSPTAAARIFHMPIGGWGYTQSAKAAYASMTAAGASNLIVAREGLGGSLDAAAKTALDAALGWIAVHLDEFISGGRQSFYTLYSLEKVGDLGDIAFYSGRDWYVEGARAILQRQQPRGGWGNHVDTSFALLFLTRATRPGVRALPPPRAVTLAGGGEAQERDLVHVDSAGGFISAREFFEFLYQTGDRNLLRTAQEVVDRYPLVRQGDLVPWILPFFSERSDPVSAFARKALVQITGETYRAIEAYRDWHRSFVAVRAAEKDEGADPERIRKLLEEAPGRRLRARVMEIISRRSLAACGPALIQEILSANPDHARRAGEILRRLAGAEPPGLSFATAGDRDVAAQSWRVLWEERGREIVLASRIRRLIALIDSGAVEGAGGKSLLEDLAAEGRGAVPYILEAMERPEYAAPLAAALERISGKRLGLRPAPWRAWWEGEGKAR